MADDINLTPGLIKNTEGQYMAPRTFSELVYMNNGDTLNSVIDDIYSIDRSCVIKTKTYSMKVGLDGEKVFSPIPMPIEDFDLEKGILFILDPSKKLIDSAKYQVDIENKSIVIQDPSIYNALKANDLIYLIYVYTDNVVAGGNYSLLVKKNCVKIKTETTELSTGFSFIKGKDTLLVYKNSVYIEESVDFELSSDGKTIKLLGDDKFYPDDIVNFILLINSNNKTVSLKSSSIVSVTSSNKINKVKIGISKYDRSTDTLFVYMNGTYLELNQDYYISPDSVYIQSVGSSFQIATSSVRFDFIVLKNIFTDIQTQLESVDEIPHKNVLDDSTGFFNEWDTDSSSDSKMTISNNATGANNYSSSIIITNSSSSTKTGLFYKTLAGKFNHKEFLTVQAKVKFEAGSSGYVLFKLHSTASNREFFSEDDLTINCVSPISYSSWVGLAKTKQIFITDDKQLNPVQLKLFIQFVGTGTVHISEIKVARSQQESDWCLSDNDVSRLGKKLIFG